MGAGEYCQAEPVEAGLVLAAPCFLSNYFKRDDYTTFTANGTYNYVDAGVQCTAAATVNGTWTLNGNVLTTSNANSVTAANPVSSFDCNQMVFTYKNYDTTGDQAIITYIRKS